MKNAAQHWPDVVLVWKLDRFGRSVHHSIQQFKALSSYSTRFLATAQGFDTGQANPTSRMLLLMLPAGAEFERELIRERIKAGMAAAKPKGTRIGRPKLLLDQKRARKLHRSGLSQRAIASALGVGKGTVARLLAA